MRGIAESEPVTGGVRLIGLNRKSQQERQAEVNVLGQGSLQIIVPHSTFEVTRAAFDVVADLAKHLRVGATLVAIQVVPYTLPLDSPPVSTQFLHRRLEELVSRSSVPVRIELLLARDREFALQQFLPEPSFILVVAERHRWWRRSAEEKLACTLKRAGHKVALVMI